MNRIAIVTGAGRGLGQAFSIRLAEDGWSVAVVARTRSEIEAAARTICNRGGNAIAVSCDVTFESSVREMVRITEEKLGPIDLLVNNAGSGRPFGPTWEASASEWWRTIEVNLRGPHLCSHAVLPGMVQRKSGRIINVASGAGAMHLPYMSAYVTSKAALIRFSELLASEAQPHGISVFAIQPGTVKTALADELLNSPEGARWLPWFRQIFEAGQDMGPEHAAEMVSWLASGAGDKLTGRFFGVHEDYKEMPQRSAEIERDDLLTLRLRH